MLAGSASFALHGGLVMLVIVVVGKGVRESPPEPSTLIPVEIVQALPPRPPTRRAVNPVTTTPHPSVNTVPRARRQQVPRPQPATLPANQSLADLTIGYDDPTNFAEKVATMGNVAGDIKGSRIGKGLDPRAEDSVATMPIPQPALMSRARPPRPKFDYTSLRLHGASRFAGRTIKVLLVVDTSGRVREVRLIEGVDRDLDRRTITLVHNFEFEPALNDDGVAIRGSQRWDIQIVEDDDEPYKSFLERGHF